MAEIVRRRSWGGVLPLGRHVSISGSRSIHAPSVSIAPSSFQEEQNARHHKQFKLEQALAEQRPTLARSRARPAASTRERCRDRPRPQQWPESCDRSANRGGSKAQPSRSQKTKPASELVCCRFE